MKIVLAGGGSGGHFYPLIAVSEAIHDYVNKERMIKPQIYYVGPIRYDKEELYRNNITYVYAPAGKVRRERGVRAFFLNSIDSVKTLLGIGMLLIRFISIYPDVVFSKGGGIAFPVIVVAKILRIPLVIHESDAVPGRTTLQSVAYAENIAVAYEEVYDYIDVAYHSKIAVTGNPIRSLLGYAPVENPEEILNIEKSANPTILVIGGSLGSEFLNTILMDALPILIDSYRIIHITGEKNFERIDGVSSVLLNEKKRKNTYIPVPFVNAFQLRALYSATDVAVTRAGSGTLTELSAWGIPSIIVPIPEKISRDQVKNAYAFSRVTGAFVMEQENITPHLLKARLNDLFDDSKEVFQKRKEQMNAFTNKDASETIATLLVNIALTHHI